MIQKFNMGCDSYELIPGIERLLAIILCFFRSTGLWRLAQGADFTEEELESIRIELKHYEQRIKKMQHLEAELKLVFFFITYFSGEAQIYVHGSNLCTGLKSRYRAQI